MLSEMQAHNVVRWIIFEQHLKFLEVLLHIPLFVRQGS